MTTETGKPSIPKTFSRNLPEIRSAVSLFDLRQRAIQYFSENDVLPRMENVLNNMFFDNPADIFGYLTEYFDQWSKVPTISRLWAHKGIDSRGQPCICVDVFATVRNHEESIVKNVSFPNLALVFDHSKIEELELDEQNRASLIQRAIDYINGELSPALKEVPINDIVNLDSLVTRCFDELTTEEQRKLDFEATALSATQSGRSASQERAARSGQKTPNQESAKKEQPKGKRGKGSGKITAPIIRDDPPETLPQGAIAVGALSAALSVAVSSVVKKPLYQLVYQQRFNCGPERSRYRLPLPLVTLLANGKAGLGKQFLIKELLLVPRLPMQPLAPEAGDTPLTYAQLVTDMLTVYNRLARNLQTKIGLTARNGGDGGAMCPLLDKPEAGLELVSEALTQLEFKERFGVVINCAAHEIFDYDKGKYELVAGTLKTTDELVEIYADYVAKQDVVGFIDPFRRADKEGWEALANRLSESAWVASSESYAVHSARKLIGDYEADKTREAEWLEKTAAELAAQAAAAAAGAAGDAGAEGESQSPAPDTTRTESPGRKEKTAAAAAAAGAAAGEATDLEATGPKVPQFPQLDSFATTNAACIRFANRNTFSELVRLSQLLEDSGNHVIVESQRGETTDTFDIDFAVGVQAAFVKIGGPIRGERAAKWNRLLEIEAELSASGRALPLDVPAPVAAVSAQSAHRSRVSRVRTTSVATASAFESQQQRAPSAARSGVSVGAVGPSAPAAATLSATVGGGGGGAVSGTASITGVPTTGAPASAAGAGSEVSVSARMSTSSAAEAPQPALRKVAPARARVFDLRQRRERALVGSADEVAELPAEGLESKRSR